MAQWLRLSHLKVRNNASTRLLVIEAALLHVFSLLPLSLHHEASSLQLIGTRGLAIFCLQTPPPKQSRCVAPRSQTEKDAWRLRTA